MSLSRAFTTRRLRLGGESGDAPKVPQRSYTTKGAPGLRHQISAPVQLIHTTNMLSYNAPDLPRQPQSDTSSRSEDDSDTLHTAESTPPTSPDVAKGERSTSPEPNHLSSYFMDPVKDSIKPVTILDDDAPPAIPKRSPSHTKKNSIEAIARSRSLSRISRDSQGSNSTKVAPTFSRSASTSTRASTTSRVSAHQALKQATSGSEPPSPTNASPHRSSKDAHPFGPELAQVTELAEEYGSAKLTPIQEEQQELESRGLVSFSANDYIDAIQSFSTAFFGESQHMKPAPLWI